MKGAVVHIGDVDIGPFAVQRQSLGIIHATVTLGAFPVLEAVLDSGDDKNGNQWQSRDSRLNNTKDRNALQNDQEQKVQVGHISKLLKQILGYKCERRVLCCADTVADSAVINAFALVIVLGCR